tara:strand:+ start:495 stop:1004 length:510 start_codon:yes stop_codon:yes gene_type:complete
MYKILAISLVLLVSFSNFSYADQKIAFINIDEIVNGSDFGKKIFKKIDKDYEKEKGKLIKIEKSLITKEQEILKQKNILSEEELNNKVANLKKEINDFQKQRSSTNEKFNKMKLDKTNYMIQNLNTILSKYADENEISLIVQKKYIVIGKANLDITDKILDIFNKEVKN